MGRETLRKVTVGASSAVAMPGITFQLLVLLDTLEARCSALTGSEAGSEP
jgi:hypothetical protein